MPLPLFAPMTLSKGKIDKATIDRESLTSARRQDSPALAQFGEGRELPLPGVLLANHLPSGSQASL